MHSWRMSKIQQYILPTVKELKNALGQMIEERTPIKDLSLWLTCLEATEFIELR